MEGKINKTAKILGDQIRAELSPEFMKERFKWAKWSELYGIMVRVEDRFEHPKKCPKPEEIKAGENLVRSSSFKISQRKPKSKPKRTTSFG